MVRILTLVFVLVLPLAGQAQSPADSLSRCLAENTSGKDRKTLGRWVFLSMAAHPELKQHVAATTARTTEETNEAVAAIFTRLVTESCVEQTKTAAKEGGGLAIQGAFQTLNALAMQELMSGRDVRATMSGFEKYLDRSKLNQVLGGSGG